MPSEARPKGIGKISVNAQAAPLVARLLRDAPVLRCGVERLSNGCRIVDAGIRHAGGLEAGLRIAEICMGGLGSVRLQQLYPGRSWSWGVCVHTLNPVLACLGSQYAGWSLSHKQNDESFHALGSGPGRALACKESLFDELGYADDAESTCLVLEVDKRPPIALVNRIAVDCGVDTDSLVLILTPTRSLAGVVQIAARVLEVAMHKAHAIGFPLERIVDGMGSAPIAPPSPDLVTAMGRTNDAIIVHGEVQLYLHGTDEEARGLCERLPSCTSPDFGRPFAEVFRDYQFDFFRVDPLLFSPARVSISVLDTGNTFVAGELEPDLLDRSFGGGE